jgi:hypothetical protein
MYQSGAMPDHERLQYEYAKKLSELKAIENLMDQERNP